MLISLVMRPLKLDHDAWNFLFARLTKNFCALRGIETNSTMHLCLFPGVGGVWFVRLLVPNRKVAFPLVFDPGMKSGKRIVWPYRFVNQRI